MKKKMLSLLLAMVMIFTMLPSPVYAVTVDDTAEEGNAAAPQQDTAAPLAEGDEKGLPIHYFLASPGNIVNPNGRYTNYGTTGTNTWPESYVYPDITEDPAWDQIQTEEGIRNVYDESIVTQYVARWPGNDAAAFKDFGSVTIDGTTYTDDKYEIKWVSIMYRDNNSEGHGLYCSQYNLRYEHIHIDGLLVEKVQPGEMEVYKTIPSAVSTETTFRFTLQKLLQPDLTSPPTSAANVDPSFTPMELTASIPAGQTQAQIVGGSSISFGYYMLTENDSRNWENNGIVMTDSNGRTQTFHTDTLFICIAPNGTVQYSTNVSGPYTAMARVAVQNKLKDVTVTYQWRVYHPDGTVSNDLPASVGAHGLPAPATGLKIGSSYVYNTGYVDGTSYHDYTSGLLYTFHGWDTYSHSSVFNADPTAVGYTALDDGDSNPANNKTVPITADTWINGYWTTSELPAADAYLTVKKNVVVTGDAAYVDNYLRNIGKMFIRIDPGIDKDNDGKSQVDVDYPGAIAQGGYRINVYQYETPFKFTELQADVPGYTRSVDITVSGDNLTLTGKNGDSATVAIAKKYDPAYAPYMLGTVTYTNRYTKNIGQPVTEYPTLELVKRAADTGLLQANAVFTLYSDGDCTEAIGSFTTNSKGVALIDFEAALADTEGSVTLYLKETAAPEGYVVDDTVYTLTLTPTEKEVLRGDEFVTLRTYVLTLTASAGYGAELTQDETDSLLYSMNVYNSPILGMLEISKVTSGLEEADKAMLEVMLTVHGPISRDAQGNITDLGQSYILSLDAENEWARTLWELPLGEYLIHENAASVHGYTWSVDDVDYGSLETEVYNNITSGLFEITPDSTEIQVTLTNYYTRWTAADFFIHKVDPQGAPLSGAAFQLYTDEACTVPVTDPAITTSAVTGSNGYAWFGGFTVPTDDADGIVTYYLRETAAPAGYYLSETVYRVDITAVADDTGTVVYDLTIRVKTDGQWGDFPGFAHTTDGLTVVNYPTTGQIVITKEMNGAPADLTSVSFYVSGSNGYAKTVELTKDGGWTATLTQLPLGEYTIIEQMADAPGYDLVTAYTVDGVQTSDKATVVLREEEPGQARASTAIVAAVTITNTYTRRETFFENPTSLTVKKVGEDGTTPLAGAVFRMDRLDEEGKEVLSSVSFTTDSEGIAIFEMLSGFADESGKLIEGKYILTETASPEGYVKADTAWKITVKEDDGQMRLVLNEDKNIFEKFWDWIIGEVSPGQWSDGVLTVRNEKKTGDLVIAKTVDDSEGYYSGAKYTFTLDSSDDDFDKTFTLKAGESIRVTDIPWGTTYTLTEDTTGAAFTSTVDDKGEGKIWADETLITVTNTYSYIGHAEPMTLVKVDGDDPKIRIEGAGFTLFADEKLTDPLTEEVFSDEEGMVWLYVETAGTYYLAETTTPEGYHTSGMVYTVIAEEKPVVKNAGTADAVTEIQLSIRIQGLTGTSENGIDYTYLIENTAIKAVEVSVSKVWSVPEGESHPDSVEAVLYRDGEEFDTVTLSADNDWSYTWTGLTDEYDWSVDEPTVPGGYSKAVSADGYDFTITNTRTDNPKTGDFTDPLSLGLLAAAAALGFGLLILMPRRKKKTNTNS